MHHPTDERERNGHSNPKDEETQPLSKKFKLVINIIITAHQNSSNNIATKFTPPLQLEFLLRRRPLPHHDILHGLQRLLLHTADIPKLNQTC